VIICLLHFKKTVIDDAVLPAGFGFCSTVSVFDFSLLAAIRQTTLHCKDRTVSRKTFREAFAKYWFPLKAVWTQLRPSRRGYTFSTNGSTHFHKFSIMDGTMRRNAALLPFPRAPGKAIVRILWIKCIN